MNFAFFLRKSQEPCPFKGVDGEYNRGYAGVLAIPHALLKLHCSCFQTEVCRVYLKILVFRGIVIAAIQVGKRKWVNNNHLCPLPWRMLSMVDGQLLP